MCDWPSGCGGDLCVCGCGGEMGCDGCDDCDFNDDQRDDAEHDGAWE